MKTFWKRAGWLGLAVTTLLASFGLQLIMAFIAVIPSSVMAGIKIGMEGITDADEILRITTEMTSEAAIWGVLLYHIVSLPVFGLWYYYGCGRKKAVWPHKVFTLKSFASTFIAGFGLCVLANGIAMSLMYLTPTLYQQYVELMESAGMGLNPVAIIAAVVFAPIGEELLCRGLAMHYAEKMTEGLRSRKAAFWIANAVQALLFGIMHANFVQGTYAFVLGLALGWLRKKYNSLYPAMLAHFAVNFLSTFVMEYLFGWIPESWVGVVILLTGGVVVTGLCVLWTREKKIEAAEAEEALG